MKTQQKLNEYFQFSKKDRVAILVIALVLLATFLLPSIFEQRASSKQSAVDTTWITALKELEKPDSGTRPETKRPDGGARYNFTADRYNNGQQADLFNFDPNTLDIEGWRRLGIGGKTIGTIQKYLAKGGHFKKADDLRKIYGLRTDQAELLIPYIRINSTAATAKPAPHSSPGYPANGLSERKSMGIPVRIAPIDINTADSLLFERLPGIGPVLASRIIRFREKLGGFHAAEQVSETFGLSDSTFEKIKPYLQISENTPLQKIDINTADLNELRRHPYLKYQIANAIINYRKQHGPFRSADDLKPLAVLDASLLQKLVPYLKFPQ